MRMIATTTSKVKIWRKRMLSTQYGYDILEPMSPSTMKVERHDPGGLLWWEELAEFAINAAIHFGTICIAISVDAAFGAIWTLLSLLVVAFSGFRIRFHFFKRRPSSVTVRYEPATIPTELIDRYEKAKTDLLQANLELEEIAALSKLDCCHALKEWRNQE